MLADDPALLAAFLDESLESIAGVEERLVALSTSAEVASEVEAIFRPVHTLKGNAPFFGFMEVQRLAHAMENILDHLRKGRMACSQAVIEALLAGLDALRGCIERIQAGNPEVDGAEAFAALLKRLQAVGSESESKDPLERAFAHLADIERHADQLDPAMQQRVARLRDELQRMRDGGNGKPAAPAAGTNLLTDLLQQMRRPLAQPLAPAAAEKAIADLQALRAAEGDGELGKLLDETLATCSVFMSSIGFDDMLRQHVVERLEQLATAPTAALTRRQAAPGGGAAQPTTEPTSDRQQPKSESHGKSMRVSEAAIDAFLAYVGELLVIGDQLEYLHRRLARSAVEQEFARDMRQAVASFTVLSGELQHSIMAVRRVAVRGLLQKAPRLVHDIAKATGKDIAVEISGEQTEVDKGRLDLLDGPLTHLIRNCADHGIESPAIRLAAGKPARGTISLKADSEDGWFTLSISDDGKGLDLAAIRRKGEQLGLIAPGATLDERTIIDLIFASGLSTANSVTSISGRGVGMDVVKRQIQESGGSITVATAAGRGTTFALRLPSAVSTQIIPAFLVRDGQGIFALPLDLVRESFVDPEVRVSADGSCVILRNGALLPSAQLGTSLGQVSSPPQPATRRTFVTIERSHAQVAFSVEETLGVHRLVIRPIPPVAGAKLDGRFQGAALLGDGRMALVVDPDQLFHLLKQRTTHG